MNFVALFVAIAVVVFPGLAFAAAPKACSCKHLESIQQELENAIYLAKFQADLSKTVADAEKKQQELRKTNPTSPEARYSVRHVSEKVWKREKALLSFPHPNVTGYTGPDSVGLEDGTCKNAAADLTALENGASCKEIGAITLKHEAKHRKDCDDVGAGTYWNRLYSEFAAEEAERYKDQAKALRALLKKVIDGSTVKVTEETNMTIKAQGLESTYQMSMPAVKLSGKSSPGSDEWELKGTGPRTSTLKSIKIPGMTCTPVAKTLTNKVTSTLKLDGLKMSLNEANVSQGGTLSVKCSVPGAGQGFGYSMAPPGETGSGEAFKNNRVKVKTETTTNITETVWGKAIAQTGVSATGTTKLKVEFICPN